MWNQRDCPWELLMGDLVERIAGYLPPNEVACVLRLVSKTIARQLQEWKRVLLSQLVPHPVFVHRWGARNSTHDLPLEQRQWLLCLVVMSGSIQNLDVVVAAEGCPSLTEGLFTLAAAAGHIHMCERLVGLGCPHRDMEAAKAAARAGHVVVVRWLLQQAKKSYRSDMACACLLEAAGSGHLALCEELLPATCDMYFEVAISSAASCGHVEISFWLLRQMEQLGERVDEPDLLSEAAFGFPLPALHRLYNARLGGMDAGTLQEFRQNQGPNLAAAALASPTPDWRAKVDWLEAAGCRLPEDEALVFNWFDNLGWEPLVARLDAVERVVLLRQRGGLDVEDLLWAAVQGASLPVLQYLRTEGLLVTEGIETVMPEAAWLGDLAVLLELLAAGVPIGREAVRAATQAGHLHVLQFLAGPEAGPAAAEALAAAMADPELASCGAGSGSLELVMWLRERGCPWDERALVAAAGSGSCALEKWMAAAGCPWDGVALSAAARSGNVALLEWMVAEGCPIESTGQPYLEAGRNDDFTTLRRLRRLARSWDPSPADGTLSRAVFDGYQQQPCSLAVLRWLVAEGCPVDWREACDRAQKRRDDEKYAVEDWAQSHLAAGSGC